MYDLKTKLKTLKLLKKYDFAITKTSRETGIKVRTITSWYEKYKKGISLKNKKRKSSCKYPKNLIMKIRNYYFKHGCNLIKACKHYNFKAYSSMKIYIQKDSRWKPKHIIINKGLKFNEDEKKRILIDFINRENKTGKEIAINNKVSRSSIYNWNNKLTCEKIMKKKKGNIDTIKLLEEIKELEKEHRKLELENKILKRANELLKKEIGVDYENLTNKEKTTVINALKDNYKISGLLKILHIKKSTYYYLTKTKEDKYQDIRLKLIEIFNENYKSYGYRRMKEALKQKNIDISEKVVRRLMKEEGLIVYQHKKRKYSSYAGEISEAPPNLLKRNFHSNIPLEKLITDITEFATKDSKVYLSPLIDCFDGKPVTYTISKSPSSSMVNSMLEDAHKIIGKTNSIIHSDRGFHYRTPSYIKLMKDYGYTQSMSKKGCSPDNSMCEGFFGTIKNEFYYSKDWSGTSSDEFIAELMKYLDWFLNKRIKIRLITKFPVIIKEINYSQTV